MAKIVIFTGNTAIVKHVPSAEEKKYKGKENVLIAPDLSLVAGVAPQFWKVVGGKVVPMSSVEKFGRRVEQFRDGVDNLIVLKEKEEASWLKRYFKKLLS